VYLLLFNPFRVGSVRAPSRGFHPRLFTLFPFREPSNLLAPTKLMLRKSVAEPSPHIYAKKADVENKDSKAAQPQPSFLSLLVPA